MNIRELAKLAGVSPSTVSKVINNKDESISPATRKRILKLVKEHNYQTYSAVKAGYVRSFVLGVLLSDFLENTEFINGFIDQAQRYGYSVILRFSKKDVELERKNLSAFIAHQVDGLLWEPINEKSLLQLDSLRNKGISISLYEGGFDNAFCIDYDPFAYKMTKTLIALGHTNIACVASAQLQAAGFLAGYQRSLFENDIPVNSQFVFEELNETLLQQILSASVSAVITAQYKTGFDLYQKVSQQNIFVPENLSILSLDKGTTCIESPLISTLSVPFSAYGRYVCEQIIAKVEKKEGEFLAFSPELTIRNKKSIAIPFQHLPKHVIVVGSINMDNYLKMETLPHSGKTVATSSTAFYSGGKALNEAIGLSKLGVRSSVIGCVGNDTDSRIVFDAMNDYGIDRTGVKRSANSKTGQAYIFVQQDGESMISIMSGANAELTAQDVSKQESLFEGASYCLIQTEIPMDAVERACQMAKAHNLPTILKPSACGPLTKEILQYVDIIAPNKEELNEICPQFKNIDEQSDWLIQQGVRTVIVTLGAEGCYVRQKGTSKYFSAVEFPRVDASGAADAFLSALTAFLLRGVEIYQAVEIANYAAGYSVSKEGVPPALIDKHLLDAYAKTILEV